MEAEAKALGVMVLFFRDSGSMRSLVASAGIRSDVLHIRKALIDRFQDTEQIICFQHQGIPVLQEAGSNLFPPVKLGLPPNIFDGFIDGAHGEAHGFIKPAEIALVPMASPCDPD